VCVCVCVCVCLREKQVDRLLSRSRCHPTPSVSGSACVCLRDKPVDRLVSRSRCHPTPSVLGCVCVVVWVWVCVSGGAGGSDTYNIPTLIKNRVGDDGVPAILQYRPSDLYPTDRKETMAILQKDTHTPLRICK
jgi:hypothetical protein